MPPPNVYWFPAKRYGWGWGPPGTWQGWCVLAGFCLAVPVGLIRIGPHRVATCLVWTVAMLLLLLLVCYLKGEPPRWRWGDRGPR